MIMEGVSEMLNGNWIDDFVKFFGVFNKKI